MQTDERGPSLQRQMFPRRQCVHAAEQPTTTMTMQRIQSEVQAKVQGIQKLKAQTAMTRQSR